MTQKQKWMLMALMIGLTVLWMQVIVPRLSKKSDGPTENAVTPATNPATAPAASGPVAATNPATTPVVPTPPVVETAPPRPPSGTVVLGSTEFNSDAKKPKSPFPLGVALSTRGAAVTSVTLNRYRSEYDKTNPYVFETPYGESSPLSAALATRRISIEGIGEKALDDVEWILEPTTPSAAGQKTARFTYELVDAAGVPQLTIVKTYEIREAADKGAGYEMLVKYELTNRTDKEQKAKVAFNGTNVPKSEHSRDLPEMVAGFDGGGKSVDVQHTPVGSIATDKPLDVAKMKEALPLLWVGVSSAYFDAIIHPTDSGGNRQPLSVARGVVMNPAEKDSLKREAAMDLETDTLVLPPHEAKSFTLNVYVGPKLREVLNSAYYSDYPMNYNETLVLISRSGLGFICGLCTWPILINMLVGLLQWFHAVFQDWGLAIIALVCIVRLLLHPITKKSQVSMSRMTKMGPEMERLKAKHKDDPDALKKAQMEFYREQGVAPMLGCLPMFLQTPIWIALWNSLQSTFEIRHAPFLHFGRLHLTWINDLSQPDRLIPFHGPVSFWFFHLDAINILPVLMAVVFYIQQQVQPKPVAATPEQEQQQKMMRWMSVFLFPIFLYNQPSGLNLYIFTSTLIGIFESKRIRDHIKEKEEREKAGVVIIDAEPGAKPSLTIGQVRRSKNTPAEPEQAPGMLGRFMAKMHKMAEDAQREAQKQKKRKK